ncbi:hypothetical protein NA57DRAFT_55402 [Rhizodiscina lignyota]|uniref:Rhodanese domain-containing protein n=1 Tax=Rhizodiscina lignyota TaxID=1504668 RepID=A0A9P4M9J7_9PEZI|nr:hypothetical protein NA57DRAFT_55402 [Rhizodiscina lignyota]
MASEGQPWYAAFPEPTETAPIFKKENLLRLFQTLGDVLEAGMLLIDLRRNDYEGGTVRGSLNIPAQSFYMNMGTLYRLCKGDGVNVITRVLFYCGSSGGRATRCAGWFTQYVAQRAADDGPQVPGSQPEPHVFVLEGGIKGWMAGGDAYTRFVHGYNPSHWQQSAPGNDATKRTIETSVDATDLAAEGDAGAASTIEKERGEEMETGAAV